MTAHNVGPTLTDERLRNWLDTNQLSRERLCQAALSLDRRFRDVRPRHPRGGRDQGRDLEAIDADGRAVWAAVGFRNSATDSSSDRNATKRKFKLDLKRALDESPDLKVFIFMTNVNLRIAEKQALLKHAHERGIDVCDIVDRERFRITLDSPEGLGFRVQYLQIPLTDAEQAAFFARWGSELQSVMSHSFLNVEQRLARIQFNQEQLQPLSLLGFAISLAQAYEASHFRVALAIGSNLPSAPQRELYLAVCDNNGRWVGADPDPRTLVGACWGDNRSEPFTRYCTHRQKPLKVVGSAGAFSNGIAWSSLRLADLDERMFALFMNRSLVERIANIRIFANEYTLWSADRDGLSVGLTDHVPEWPWSFSAAELADPWARVTPPSDQGIFDFTSVTPTRRFAARPLT